MGDSKREEEIENYGCVPRLFKRKNSVPAFCCRRQGVGGDR
jgi:hypothetical protein